MTPKGGLSIKKPPPGAGRGGGTIKKKTKTTTELTWKSYINSKKMTEKQFLEFLVFMGSFYEASLENLKISLEK